MNYHYHASINGELSVITNELSVITNVGTYRAHVSLNHQFQNSKCNNMKYICHALVNTMSTHSIHINLNAVFCTRVDSSTKTIYIRHYMHTHTYTHTHRHTPVSYTHLTLPTIDDV